MVCRHFLFDSRDCQPTTSVGRPTRSDCQINLFLNFFSRTVQIVSRNIAASPEDHQPWGEAICDVQTLKKIIARVWRSEGISACAVHDSTPTRDRHIHKTCWNFFLKIATACLRKTKNLLGNYHVSTHCCLIWQLSRWCHRWSTTFWVPNWSLRWK